MNAKELSEADLRRPNRSSVSPLDLNLKKNFKKNFVPKGIGQNRRVPPFSAMVVVIFWTGLGAPGVTLAKFLRHAR